jgi:hypothetical protein
VRVHIKPWISKSGTVPLPMSDGITPDLEAPLPT